MTLKLRLSILFFIIGSFSFAQTGDSLKTKKKQPVSFSIIAGPGFIADVNKPYKNQPGDNGAVSINYNDKDFNLDFYKRIPVLKALFSGNLNKHSGFDWGLKYSSFTTNADLQTTPRPGVYYFHTDGHLTSAINEVQVIAGPRINVQQFYFSGTLNMDVLFMKQTAAYNGSQYQRNKRSIQYCTGAGVNVGYELPLKKNSLLFELECDYISRRQYHALNYFGHYNFQLLNPAICIGYKFSERTYAKRQITSDSLKIKPEKRASFEVMLGLTMFECLNKPFDKTTSTPYGYKVEGLTFKDQGNKSFTSFKFAFTYKFNKYLGIVLGLKYAYIGAVKYSYYYHTYSTTTPPVSAYYHDVSGREDFESKVIHDVQLFAGPKISFKNFYFAPTANANLLRILQNITRSSGTSNLGGGPIISSDIDFTEDNVWNNDLAAGVGANVGYEQPINKKCTFKIELQCDYLERNIAMPAEGNMRFLGKGIALGLRF